MEKLRKLDENNISPDMGGVLAKLTRTILQQGERKTLLWRINNHVLSGRDNKSKSTLVGFFIKPSLTWKVFVYLMVEILLFDEMNIKITLKRKGEKDITASVDIIGEQK